VAGGGVSFSNLAQQDPDARYGMRGVCFT